MHKLFIISAIASVIAAQTTFAPQIPPKVIAKALVANMDSNVPIPKQWKDKTAVVKFAWDLNADCYSEMWTLAGVVDINSVICGTHMQTYNLGTC